MLQEILLSLSGVPSPIWEELTGRERAGEKLRNYVTPSEQAMLASLSHISRVHIELKDHTASISSKHPSFVCRAVSASIAHTHLTTFRKRVVAVERSILSEDASHVGGYQIVPLSTLVADFAPWKRRLEWLLRLTHFINGSKSNKLAVTCTAAALLQHLETERHTGFSDVEDIATQLLTTAQGTWMRALSSWVLYGQLPSNGKVDFMIQRAQDTHLYQQYVLDEALTPRFVSARAAQAILAIGSALAQLQSRNVLAQSEVTQGIAMTLQTANLQHIKLLKLPVKPPLFETTILKMNESISRHALSHILPRHNIIEVCKFLQEYMLLGRGEFATTLIENSDARVLARHKSHLPSRPGKKLGRVEDVVIKDSELDTILSKTWADLASLHINSGAEDETFSLARKHLKFKSDQKLVDDTVEPQLATILPTPALLSLDIIASSPLAMFLSPSITHQYSRICSYLLSLRRSQLRLSSLWKMTSHRRCYPTPTCPPLSATAFGRRACRQRRAREENRASQMRRYWSSMSKSLFLLNELSSYLHGEVIGNSWEIFSAWLETGNNTSDIQTRTDSQVPQLAGSLQRSLVESPNLNTNPILDGRLVNDDPRTLANAHSAYLSTLTSALLLDNKQLVILFKGFLELIDHIVGLFARLSSVWEGLDLQEDDGVMDAFSNYIQDEKDVLTELSRARSSLETMLEQVVDNLKSIDQAQSTYDGSEGIANLGISHGPVGDFVPWKVRTLDRLLMKLDFLHSKAEQRDDLVDEFDYE